MRRAPYAVIAEEWSSSGRFVGNRIARGSSPSSAHRHWAAGQAAPPAPPAHTLEQARVESRLSLLMLASNQVKQSADTHESAVEIARHALVPLLDEVVMTATGALHATTARPDLVASAVGDATLAQLASSQAAAAAAGPLGKVVAAEMVRASSAAVDVAALLATLPGRTPAPGPAPAPPGASHEEPPGGVAELDPVVLDEDLAPPPRRRGKGVAVAALGGLGLLMLLGRR